MIIYPGLTSPITRFIYMSIRTHDSLSMSSAVSFPSLLLCKQKQKHAHWGYNRFHMLVPAYYSGRQQCISPTLLAYIYAKRE